MQTPTPKISRILAWYFIVKRFFETCVKYICTLTYGPGTRAAFLLAAVGSLAGCSVSTSNLPAGTRSVEAEIRITDNPVTGMAQAKVTLKHGTRPVHLAEKEQILANGYRVTSKRGDYTGRLKTDIPSSLDYDIAYIDQGGKQHSVSLGSAPIFYITGYQWRVEGGNPMIELTYKPSRLGNTSIRAGLIQVSGERDPYEIWSDQASDTGRITLDVPASKDGETSLLEQGTVIIRVKRTRSVLGMGSELGFSADSTARLACYREMRIEIPYVFFP